MFGSLVVLRLGVLQRVLGVATEVVDRNELGPERFDPLEPLSQESEPLRRRDGDLLDSGSDGPGRRTRIGEFFGVLATVGKLDADLVQGSD